MEIWMQRGNMFRTAALCLAAAVSWPAPAAAQEGRAWLESQGLEAGEGKSFEDFEAVVARAKGAPKPEERVVVFQKGKVAWQSAAKDAPAGSRWTVHSLGRDLDGDKSPDMHVSSQSPQSGCCTTHYVYRLKPQVRRVAAYDAGHVAGGDFVEIPGRRAPVMISADDAYAAAFAPHATSYFPVVVLEVAGGRMRMVRELMQSKLPGQPPPVCEHPTATANPWLKERCGEYVTSRRNARANNIKQRLVAIKAERSVDKLKWEDYYGSGILAAITAELNRYAYTGHGGAGLRWLETIWPGNDAIKLKMLQTLRETQAKSRFAADLKAIASDYK
jgi:hypothetical protein